LRWELSGRRCLEKSRMIRKKTDLLFLTHSDGIILVRLLALGESITERKGGSAVWFFYEHATLSDILTLGRL
jgi:hypothetical protein